MKELIGMIFVFLALVLYFGLAQFAVQVFARLVALLSMYGLV